MKKKLSVEEMYRALKSGRFKLRSLASIKNRRERGYNKNYIRDWFIFPSK